MIVMDTPSPNGSNGRTSSGRFAPGNPGGPGNPHGRRVAQLRAALISAVSDDDIKEIIQTIVAKAKNGELSACKILFEHVIGRALPAPDPDRAELEGEELSREKRRVEQVKFERESGFKTAL